MSAHRADRSAGVGPWVATEKIGGAHLTIAYGGRDFAVGTRDGWLRSDEPCYGWQLLRSRIRLASKVAFARGGGPVRIYGVLYGGRYPHPDVAVVPGTVAVRLGTWYSPDIRLAIFDVLVHRQPDDAGVFLTYAEVADIAAAADLDVVPLLAQLRHPSLVDLPDLFATRVPDGLGLPQLPGNMATGIVLHPDTPLPPERRPAVQLIPFIRDGPGTFDRTQSWDRQISLTVAELRTIAGRMLDTPHVADLWPTDPSANLDEVVLAVMIDLCETYPRAMTVLTADQEAWLTGYLRQRVTAGAVDRARPQPVDGARPHR